MGENKKDLRYLGVYDRCKRCGGSLKYKQANLVRQYKSTCASCKKERAEYFKKQYYKQKGWAYEKKD